MKLTHCERCGRKLSGKQERWCSPTCSKYGLKAIYKKKNKEKVNTYNRRYRRVYGYHNFVKLDDAVEGVCYFCSTIENIHGHHLDYEQELTIDLCGKCHVKYHKLLKLQKPLSPTE